jgi:hypothetical protein
MPRQCKFKRKNAKMPLFILNLHCRGILAFFLLNLHCRGILAFFLLNLHCRGILPFSLLNLHWHFLFPSNFSAIELCCFKLKKIRPIGYFECKCTCSETETDEIFYCIEQG